MVKEIPRQEKQQLLEKVQQSMAMFEPIEEPSSAGEATPQAKRQAASKAASELERALKKEMESLRFFEKLALRLQRLFTRKSLQDLFLERKLDDIKNSIESSGFYVDFKKQALTVKFASEVFKVYSLCVPLRPLFNNMWRDAAALNLIINRYLDKQLGSGIKKETPDFMSVDQMLRIFMEKNDAEAVRRALLKSVKDYTDTLPDARFKEIREELLPFYCMQSLILFPFHEILTLFGMAPAAPEEKLPVFRPAPVGIVKDYLHKMAYVFHISNNQRFSQESLDTVFSAVFASGGIDEKESLRQTELKRRALDQLQEAAAVFVKNVPLLDIVRYLEKNPYFNVSFSFPRMDLKQFYANSTRLNALAGFGEAMQQVRLAYIDSSVASLFSGLDFAPLSYYVDFANEAWLKARLPVFSHTKSLAVCNTFLKMWCPERFFPVINIISRSILLKSPSLQTKLNDLRGALEALEERLRRFDQSLAPETEEGKNFVFLRSHIKTNTTQERLAKSLVEHKDLEAAAIETSAVSLLTELERFINTKVAGSGVESVKTALAGVYPALDRSRSLNDLLTQRLAEARSFCIMLKELLEYEKGSSQV